MNFKGCRLVRVFMTFERPGRSCYDRKSRNRWKRVHTTANVSQAKIILHDKERVNKHYGGQHPCHSQKKVPRCSLFVCCVFFPSWIRRIGYTHAVGFMTCTKCWGNAIRTHTCRRNLRSPSNGCHDVRYRTINSQRVYQTVVIIVPGYRTTKNTETIM